MTTLREAAQQALEALGCIEYGINGIEYGPSDDTTESAITALRAALAQQEPPTPLYTAPPRREWKGLSEEEIIHGREQLLTEDLCGWSFRQGLYFAEAKLKELNHG